MILTMEMKAPKPNRFVEMEISRERDTKAGGFNPKGYARCQEISDVCIPFGNASRGLNPSLLNRVSAQSSIKVKENTYA